MDDLEVKFSQEILNSALITKLRREPVDVLSGKINFGDIHSTDDKSVMSRDNNRMDDKVYENDDCDDVKNSHDDNIVNDKGDKSDEMATFDSLVDNLKPGESSAPEPEVLHPCPLCKEEFRREESLELHMCVHSGDRTCPACGKQFAKRVYLKRHLSSHMSHEKRFKCDVCFKCFADQRYLSRHSNIHVRDNILNFSMLLAKDFEPKRKRRSIPSSEKPFQCDTCNKGFLNECTLKAHIAIHTGQTPYKCVECDKGFINSSHLKYHLSRHTGDKQFICGICTQTFSQSSNLKRHIRVNHKPDLMP